MKSKEFEFYVKADLSKYEGKYVAIVEDKVVTFGDNAKEVWEEAKKKFPKKNPMLAKVPRAETFIFNVR
ncbi:succinyl-CoA synthetase subunit alpha [Candidatus Woesearchaeota archaeon]|nr:succinyl-CoA synthetase subunit alpha [Candidatus Woesearchaeota archaeon]